MIGRGDTPAVPGHLKPSPCPHCRRSVLITMLPDQGVISLHPNPLSGTPDPSLDVRDAGVCVTQGGVPAREGGTVLVWRVHAGLCPELRKRDQEARDRGLDPRKRYQTPQTGECGRCRRPVLWIYTKAGKRVPLDPDPHVGIVLDKAEARGLKGAPELVRGYEMTGEVLAIREDGPGQLLLMDSTRERTTVYITHFATCPEADAYRANGRKPR